MINLTINKADLKRQLAEELAEIRDGNSGVTASALVFTKDDRYSLAVRVTGARSGYTVNVRTFIGGEAADGDTTLIKTIETTCANVAEIIEFVTACAGCADLDAKADAAPVDPAGREFYVATISGTEGNQVVVDTVRAASEEAAALDVAARVYGGAFFDWLNARRDMRGVVVVFWLTCTDRDGYAPITVHAVNPELAAPMSQVRSALVCAMADRDRPLRMRPSELRAIAGARRSAPREFYAATLSGTAAHPEVVERVAAADIDAAADMVAARTYGTALSYGERRRINYDHGAVLYWYRSTGGSLVPVVLAPADRPFNVDTRVSAVMRRDGMTQRHVIVRACLEWAQLKRGEIVTTADGLSPWTVIAIFPDNGQIYGEHVLARDGTHALALVAAGMCAPDNDEDGVPDCDLICAIAGHVSEPNIEYAGGDVVSAAQYLANHGAE